MNLQKSIVIVTVNLIIYHRHPCFRKEFFSQLTPRQVPTGISCHLAQEKYLLLPAEANFLRLRPG